MIFPKEWSTHKKLLFAMGLAGKEVEDTATGNPLTFLTDLAKPLKSLIVNFMPVQSSGTPSPENELPITGWTGLNVEHYGENLYKNGNKSLTRYLKVTLEKPLPSGTYTIRATTDAQGEGDNCSIGFARADNDVIKIVRFPKTGRNSQKFTINDTVRVIYLYSDYDYEHSAGLSATFSDIVIVEGASLNVYPVIFGKNLFNKDAVPYRTGKYINNNSYIGGAPQYTDNANYNVFSVPIKKKTTYTFGLIKATQPCFALVDANNKVTFVDTNKGGENGTYRTITTGENDVYLLLSVSVNGTYKCDDILQVEEGAEHTQYEPFNNGVYGGYVDLVTGEVWKTWEEIASYDGETLPGVWKSDRDVYSAGGTPTTGAQVVYELASPVLITTITPQQITAIKGNNTVWSDANGEMTAVYLKKG